MLKAQIIYDGRRADAILLCRFTAAHTETREVRRRFFLFNRRKFEEYTAVDKFFLAFIPWKRREKEIAVIRPENIIGGISELPREWQTADTYVSAAEDELGVTVSDFLGYPFIARRGDFICNEFAGRREANLELLYANLPELLLEEFDDE